MPLWANPTLYAPAARDDQHPNVILLSIDTLRADHLGSYGYRHDKAPFVDERFARGGTVFDTEVAAATITTPSHASMFTSLNPAVHGTTDGMKLLPKNIPTLAERMRHAGLFAEHEIQPFLAPAFLVRVGDRKLERYRTENGGVRYEYYDVAADPLEAVDLPLAGRGGT